MRILVFVILSSLGNTFASYGQGVGMTRFLNFLLDDATPLSIDAIGSPNFDDEWQSGKIIDQRGNSYDIDSMRYNVYLKNILFHRDGVDYALPPSFKLSGFKINDSNFIYIPFKGSETRDFFQILSDGKIKLLKRFQCILIEGSPDDGLVAATKPKFKMKYDYYISRNGAVAKKLKRRKSHLKRLLRESAQSVSTFLDTKQVSLKNELHLIRAFELYNSLE